MKRWLPLLWLPAFLLLLVWAVFPATLALSGEGDTLFFPLAIIPPGVPTATATATAIATATATPPATATMIPGGPEIEWALHKTADGLHPDGNEQQMMWLMNRARADPPAEGFWLATSTDDDIAWPRDFFNVDVDVLQSEFNSYPAKPPAAFDVRLYNAARAHSEDLILRDAQDHDGQFERVAAAGFVCAGGRGNVFSFAHSAVYAHAGFNIDWGGGPPDGMQAGRGHRKAIMSLDGDYTNVGVAMVPEDNPATNVGPLVTTGNYCHAGNGANHYNRFLVGTVWSDDNGNGMYDAGEGWGGVTVRPDHGDYFAVTGASGGYAIPILEPGSYHVTFSGAVNAHRSVDIGATSVLLDLTVARRGGTTGEALPEVAPALPYRNGTSVRFDIR